ncbi:MAG: hypothetical protein ACTSVI_01060 [Promethearchaeota archaeon]
MSEKSRFLGKSPINTKTLNTVTHENVEQDTKATSLKLVNLEPFLILNEGGDPVMIIEAIRYFETHDGCPIKDSFFYPECICCNGVWIKMGVICSHFLDVINPMIRKFKERKDEKPREKLPNRENT